MYCFDLENDTLLFFIDTLVYSFDSNYVESLYDIIYSNRIRLICDKKHDLNV